MLVFFSSSYHTSVFALRLFSDQIHLPHVQSTTEGRVYIQTQPEELGLIIEIWLQLSQETTDHRKAFLRSAEQYFHPHLNRSGLL